MPRICNHFEIHPWGSYSEVADIVRNRWQCKSILGESGVLKVVLPLVGQNKTARAVFAGELEWMFGNHLLGVDSKHLRSTVPKNVLVLLCVFKILSFTKRTCSLAFFPFLACISFTAETSESGGICFASAWNVKITFQFYPYLLYPGSVRSDKPNHVSCSTQWCPVKI